MFLAAVVVLGFAAVGLVVVTGFVVGFVAVGLVVATGFVVGFVTGLVGVVVAGIVVTLGVDS